MGACLHASSLLERVAVGHVCWGIVGRRNGKGRTGLEYAYEIDLVQQTIFRI